MSVESASLQGIIGATAGPNNLDILRRALRKAESS